MNNIAIVGAGGFGREILLMINQINNSERIWKPIGFFDDRLSAGAIVDGSPVLGKIDDLNKYKEEIFVVIAVADPQIRRKIKERVKNPRITFPFLAHPAANLGSESNKFHQGVIITAGVICTTGIVANDFAVINLASTIGHDVRIGKFSMLMPACHISGNVSIGDGVMIGTGASVLQNLKIGNGSTIGAGAVVTKDVKEGTTVIGIPAKPKE